MTEVLSEDPWTDEVCRDWEQVFFQRAVDSGDSVDFVVKNMDSAPLPVQDYWTRRSIFLESIFNISKVNDSGDTDR